VSKLRKGRVEREGGDARFLPDSLVLIPSGS
jgi:hypothetical protein